MLGWYVPVWLVVFSLCCGQEESRICFINSDVIQVAQKSCFFIRNQPYQNFQNSFYLLLI